MDTIEKQLEIQGYGYFTSDNDGNGEHAIWIGPIEHKEEEFFEAARQLLDTQEIKPEKTA